MMNEYENRLKILGGLIVCVIMLLIARAGYLQVYQGDEYVRRADGNRTRLIPTMAPRGTFFDRNGLSIVENRPGFTVSLLPLTAHADSIRQRIDSGIVLFVFTQQIFVGVFQRLKQQLFVDGGRIAPFLFQHLQNNLIPERYLVVHMRVLQ